jgi:esterase
MPASHSTVLSSTSIAAVEAAGSRRLFALHGIYGRGRNWTTMARALAAARPDWSVVLLDLRLHGDSPAFDPPHTVGAAAGDVAAYERETGAHASAVLGHSFGGKVALAHTAAGHDHLSQVWIVDSTPEARAPDGSAWRMLGVIGSLPADFASRAEAAAAIAAGGYSRGVASWMASNLGLVAGRYRWRLDFDAIGSMLADFFHTDLWHVVEDPPEGTVLRFVKAEESNVLTEDACRRIDAAGRRHGRAFVHRVAGGHWVHVDNPRAVLDLLVEHLPWNTSSP